MREYFSRRSDTNNTRIIEELVNKVRDLELREQRRQTEQQQLNLSLQELQVEVEHLREQLHRQTIEAVPIVENVIYGGISADNNIESERANVIGNINNHTSDSATSTTRETRNTRTSWKHRDGRTIHLGDRVAFLTPTVHASDFGTVCRFDNNWVYAIDKRNVEIYKKGRNLRIVDQNFHNDSD